jgi:hypothetical protein
VKKILLLLGVCVALALGAVVWFFVAFYMSMERGEEHRRQLQAEQRSGKWDFGDQPALFAVAQAIARNDQDAIRAAAKDVPDLQAAGRDGTTLLFFAVKQTWHHDERVEAVKTLLSAGANPNYNNGQRDSFALVEAAEGSALVLRAMLEAGGDANGRDEQGVPIILSNWKVSYYTDSQSRARLDLLLDHGADINSTMPGAGPCCTGDSLLVYRTSMGPEDGLAYADALHLLERGADPHRAAANGKPFATMLMEHREQFSKEKKAPPPSFEALWQWAQAHEIEMVAGSFAKMPIGMKHFVWTTGETIVQIHSTGPFEIKYVNPADDPRNAKK